MQKINLIWNGDVYEIHIPGVLGTVGIVRRLSCGVWRASYGDHSGGVESGSRAGAVRGFIAAMA